MNKNLYIFIFAVFSSQISHAMHEIKKFDSDSSTQPGNRRISIGQIKEFKSNSSDRKIKINQARSSAPYNLIKFCCCCCCTKIHRNLNGYTIIKSDNSSDDKDNHYHKIITLPVHENEQNQSRWNGEEYMYRDFITQNKKLYPQD